MPCYEVNTISLKWTIKNKDRLLEALKQEGYHYRDQEDRILAGPFEFDLAGGGVIIKTSNKTEAFQAFQDLNSIKRKYSEAVLKEIAKKKKWAFKMTELGKYKMTRY